MRKDSKIPSLNEKEWEKPIFILSLRVVGVLCLIRGIQELIIYLIRFTSLGEKPGFLTAQNWGGVISTIVVLIISVYLISGAKKFVKFLLRQEETTYSLWYKFVIQCCPLSQQRSDFPLLSRRAASSCQRRKPERLSVTDEAVFRPLFKRKTYAWLGGERYPLCEKKAPPRLQQRTE